MTRTVQHTLVALGMLAAPLTALSQPAKAPEPAAQTADAPRTAETDEATKAVKIRERQERLRNDPYVLALRQHREQMAAMTDEQLEAHLRELIREAGETETQRWQAEMAEKSLADAYRKAPDEDKPDLYILRVESTAKAWVLQSKSQSLHKRAGEAIGECSRRYADGLKALPIDQLKARLRDLVARQVAAQQQSEMLKAEASDDKGAGAGASRSAELEMSWIRSQLDAVECAYRNRLMADEQ